MHSTLPGTLLRALPPLVGACDFDLLQRTAFGSWSISLMLTHRSTPKFVCSPWGTPSLCRWQAEQWCGSPAALPSDGIHSNSVMCLPLLPRPFLRLRLKSSPCSRVCLSNPSQTSVLPQGVVLWKTLGHKPSFRVLLRTLTTSFN